MQETSLNPHRPATAGDHVVTDKIAVIIPFYQERPGILRRAVESVCAQTGVSDVEVIVVDDGSPRSAKDELQDFSTSAEIPIQIIEQRNSGPGAARNTGLENVSEDVAYVAFLDSDDEWLADHLSRAVSVLEQGYDFYFSNLFEVGQTIGVFDEYNLIELDKHIPLRGLDDAYEYRGDFFLQEIGTFLQGIGKPIAPIPTIVYRYADFPDIRFPEQFRYAHEDTLWRLEFAAREPGIAFSIRPECQLGTGANVHRGAKWGTERALNIIYCNVMFRTMIQKKYTLNKEQRIANKGLLNTERRDFASNVLHIMVRECFLGVRLLARQIVLDPMSLLSVFYVGLAIIKNKTLSLKR